MTEKELKKLNRYQLLELLMMQTERADRLQEKLEETERLLNEKTIRISELGSIAEAALQLNKVFEAAQNAADQYRNEAVERAEREATLIIERAKVLAMEMK